MEEQHVGRGSLYVYTAEELAEALSRRGQVTHGLWDGAWFLFEQLGERYHSVLVAVGLEDREEYDRSLPQLREWLRKEVWKAAPADLKHHFTSQQS